MRSETDSDRARPQFDSSSRTFDARMRSSNDKNRGFGRTFHMVELNSYFTSLSASFCRLSRSRDSSQSLPARGLGVGQLRSFDSGESSNGALIDNGGCVGKKERREKDGFYVSSRSAEDPQEKRGRSTDDSVRGKSDRSFDTRSVVDGAVRVAPHQYASSEYDALLEDISSTHPRIFQWINQRGRLYGKNSLVERRLLGNGGECESPGGSVFSQRNVTFNSNDARE